MSPREFLSGVMNFFLKARSHCTDSRASTYRVLGLSRARSSIPHCQIFDTPSNRDADSRFGRLSGILPLQYGVSGALLEAGSSSGTKSRAASISVPIALLRSSSRRSESIFITFEVTTFGHRRGTICRERAISINELPDLDLYHLRFTLHYIWPRCAPHRPAKRPDCWEHCSLGHSPVRQ